MLGAREELQLVELFLAAKLAGAEEFSAVPKGGMPRVLGREESVVRVEWGA